MTFPSYACLRFQNVMDVWSCCFPEPDPECNLDLSLPAPVNSGGANLKGPRCPLIGLRAPQWMLVVFLLASAIHPTWIYILSRCETKSFFQVTNHFPWRSSNFVPQRCFFLKRNLTSRFVNTVHMFLMWSWELQRGRATLKEHLSWRCVEHEILLT